MKKTTLITLLSALVLFTGLLITGCSKEKTGETNEGEKPIPVKTISLTKENVKLNINASGQFTTDDETYLSFKTGGIVKSVFVKEGDAVKKGQVLALLDVTEIQAMVKQAQTGYEKAERDYARAKKLYQDSVATLEQFENAKSGLDFAKEQLTIAQHNLNYSEIRAGSDGYILKRFLNEGQMAGPGMPVLQTNGAGKGNWVLRVSVSDKDWASLSTGDRATITADVHNGTQLNARVSRRSEAVDPYSGTFTADLMIEGKGSMQLASGLFGKAVITPSKSLSSWKVPLDAILDGDGSKGFVFATADGKTAKRIEVRIAAVTKDYVLVTGGLENAGQIIISGSAYLTDGAAITITQ